MKVINTMVERARQLGTFVTTQTRAHKVDILVFAGVALSVAAAYDAYNAGKKIDKLKEEPVNEDKPRTVTKDTVIAVARPVLMEACSIYCVLKAVNIVKSEKAMLSAALATSLATQQKLLERTSDMFGEESAQKIEEGRHSFTDNDEPIDIANDFAIVINEDTVPENSPLRRNMQSKLMLVDTIRFVEKAMDHEYQMKGFMFESDIYERLDLDPTVISRLVGWCLPDEKHPLPGDEHRARHISFGLEELYEQIKTNDYDPKIEVIIRPNVDGAIWDIYDKYNRNKVLDTWNS